MLKVSAFNKRKILATLFGGMVLLAIFPINTLAVTVTVNNFPSTISTDPFSVDVAITGAATGTNYLRVDLYKENTSNYFGETFNGTDWHSDSTGTNYFPVQIQNASGSATVQAKLGNPSSGDYPGPGSYKMKIRRYTSATSYTFGDPVDVQITYATPSPSPTAAPTATTAATSSPTHTPSPTAKPTATATAKPVVTVTNQPTTTTSLVNQTSTPTPNASVTDAASLPPEVLAASTNKVEVQSEKTSSSFLPLIPIILGVGLLGFAILPFVKEQISKYNNKDAQENN